MKRFTCLVIFLLLVIFAELLFAQQDSSAAPQYYKPSEIPMQLDNASSFLVHEKNSIIGSTMIKNAKKMLERLNKNFENLNSISDSTNLNQYNSVQLRNINRRWEILQHQMGQSLSSISERTRLLEEKEKQLHKLLAVWELTKKKDTQHFIPTDLLNSITTLENEIKNFIEIIQKESNELLSIQSGFSSKNMIIETKRILLKDLIISKQRAAFERNTYPLWKFFSDTTATEPITIQSQNLLSTYKSAIKNFFDYYGSKIPLGILVFLFFLGFTLTLKYYSNKIEDDSPTIQKALLLLRNPFSISLLLFLFFLSVTTEAATTFNGLRKILMLIPLLFILLKIIDPKLKSGLYIFMFLFLVKELKVNTGSDTLIERFLLLALTLLTYLAVYWVYKNNRLPQLLSNEKLIRFVNVLVRINLIIITLVLILNILGYVMLANILINGFYNSIYATIILLSANLVFSALILLLLKTKPMQKLKIVSLHSASIISISNKIIKVIFSVIWMIIVLSSFQIYDLVYNEISAILNTDIGYGSLSISLADIILFFVTIWISFQLSRFIQFVLEIDVLPQFRLPRGVPGAVLSLSRYTIISLGLLLAFMSIGIDFNKFAILIGALGVGIGFGLQNLVNNFISGIILIFERPIQVGDVIKVGELTGSVKKIGLRASIVRTFEGADIIVPNGNLISAELTNWTFSDQHRRMDIAVGVEYGSDVNKVKEILLNIAKEEDKILQYPYPIVLFHNFGDSSLDFILRCWTSDFNNWLEIESNLRFKINAAFEENNITIPFPQTDIHFKENLKIENTNDINNESKEP